MESITGGPRPFSVQNRQNGQPFPEVFGLWAYHSFYIQIIMDCLAINSQLPEKIIFNSVIRDLTSFVWDF